MSPRVLLRFGEFHLDPVDQSLWREGRRVALAPKAFAVLSHLLERPDRLVTKDELMEALWPNVCVCDAALKVQVRELRQVLGDRAREPRYIETSHRRGYRFIATVTPVSGVPGAPGARLARPPVESSLVGRRPVLSELDGHLQGIRRGERRTVFVTGGVGAGKSAVVDAFLEHARSCLPDALIVSGQCLEHHGGTDEPFLPVLEALGRACRADPSGRLLARLGRIAPTWLARLPWLIDADEGMPPPREPRGGTSGRMLREMGELCESLGDDSPVVLVLEDLHRCDYATLDLIASLASRRDPCPLLVLGSYRPAELLLRAHPLRTVRQELDIARRCAGVTLEPLEPGDVEELLSLRFPGHAFPPDFARVIHRRSDGNPLFVIGLLEDLIARRHLLEQLGRWHLMVEPEDVLRTMPETLRRTIELLFERLDHERRTVLSGASVAGTAFTADEIATGGLLDRSEVEDCCARLAEEGLFIRALEADARPDGSVSEGYAFVHGLYRDVLAGCLSPARRDRLHHEIGSRADPARPVENPIARPGPHTILG